MILSFSSCSSSQIVLRTFTTTCHDPSTICRLSPVDFYLWYLFVDKYKRHSRSVCWLSPKHKLLVCLLVCLFVCLFISIHRPPAGSPQILNRYINTQINRPSAGFPQSINCIQTTLNPIAPVVPKEFNIFWKKDHNCDWSTVGVFLRNIDWFQSILIKQLYEALTPTCPVFTSHFRMRKLSIALKSIMWCISITLRGALNKFPQSIPTLH